MTTALEYMLRLIARSDVATFGQGFDEQVDLLARATRELLTGDERRADFAKRAAGVAACALGAAFAGHGAGRAFDWQEALTACAEGSDEHDPCDALTRAVVRLGDCRAPHARADDIAARALDVARAALALGLERFGASPPPARHPVEWEPFGRGAEEPQ